MAADVVLREPAEFASAVVAEEAGIPHVQVAVGLVEAHQMIIGSGRGRPRGMVAGAR